MTRVTLKESISTVLFASLELSKSTWVVALSDHNGLDVSVHRCAAGDLDQLQRIFEKAKKRLRLPKDAVVRTCYEAGRDGFWIARALSARGIENVVVNPASIEVPKGQKAAKTDKIDAKKLLEILLRLARGQTAAKLVTVPTPEQEDLRQATRERESLHRALTAVSNQISALLCTQGLQSDGRSVTKKALEDMRLWNGEALPGLMHERLSRAIEQRDHVKQHLAVVNKTLRRDFQTPKIDDKAKDLHQLRGVGVVGAQLLVREMFWRDFDTRREVGGYTGLCSVPHQSGSSKWDAGISRAGNPRVRGLLIEQAWGWLRHQPNSDLTKWYDAKFGHGRKSKLVGIVAVARKLAVAFWRLLKFGEVPAGAVLRSEA